MATDIVDDGSANNDGNGDTLRAAFTAINLVLQKADSTSGGAVRIYEDTDSGTNYSEITAGTTAITSNRTITVPDADVDLGVINTIQTTTNGEGASLIGVEDAATNFSGAEVEACLTELGALFTTANGEGASLVGIEDSGALITATDVEGALAENRALIDTNTTHVGGDGSDHSDVAANTVKTAIVTMAVAGTGTQIDMAEPTGGGSSAVTLEAPALAANATVTLPNATVNLQNTVDKADLITVASASAAASIALAEDTDNGSNTATIIAPAAVTSNRTVTLPDFDLDFTAVHAENTDGQLFIPASEMVAVSGTWTLSESSNVAIQTRSTAAASHKVIFPIDLRGRTTASKGAKITSIELVYQITTEVADDVQPALIVTTLGGTGVAPTAAAAAVTFATATDSAAKRGAVAELTAVATVDSPAYIADNKGYHVSVTVDDTTGGGAVVIMKGLLVNFSETLLDAS
jgi:hypothetical protein